MNITHAQAAAYGIKVPKKKSSYGRTKPQGRPVDNAQGRNKLFDAACVSHGLPIPVSEYEFCSGRKWRFDYLFEGVVALEIEGGVYGIGKPCSTCGRKSVGAHSSIANIKRDIEKYNMAQEMGYQVYRCLPEDIESGAIFETIKRALSGE